MTKDQIMDAIKNMNVVELADMVKVIGGRVWRQRRRPRGRRRCSHGR